MKSTKLFKSFICLVMPFSVLSQTCAPAFAMESENPVDVETVEEEVVTSEEKMASTVVSSTALWSSSTTYDGDVLIDKDAFITVTSKAEITIKGDLIIKGKLINNGTLKVSGTIYCLNYNTTSSTTNYNYGYFINKGTVDETKINSTDSWLDESEKNTTEDDSQSTVNATLYLEEGKTSVLTEYVDNYATWNTSDESIVSLGSTSTSFTDNISLGYIKTTCQITAVKPGEAFVYLKGNLNSTTYANYKVVVDAKGTVRISSISMNKKTTSIEKGGNETLSVTVNPENTTEDTTVTWTSSDDSIATVENGVVTGLLGGKVTITATIGTHSDTCEVTVLNPISSIALSEETKNLLVESTLKLTASILPTDTPDDQTITWSSSDTNVATVSNKGVVTAIAAGTATITAKTSNGLTATCIINVWNKTTNVTSVKNGDEGVNITWEEVPGATRYSVYRKVTDGNWKALKTGITATTYTDTTAESGTKYYYTMLATDGDIKTSYNTTGKYVTYLSKPVISSIKNTDSALKITWNEVTGATNYIIYDEEGNKIDTTTSTSYTDTTATESGTTYNYKVKAKTGSSTYSVNSDISSFVKLAQPTLSSAKNVEDGVKFTWKAVNGAATYNVYRKVSGGSWSLKAKGIEGTSWVDTKATSGKKYYYSVKAVNGSSVSTYNTTGKYVTYLSRPVITKVTKAKTYNSVKFNAVTGAESYIVYSVSDAGKLTKLGTVTAGSATTYTFKDEKATKAGTYRYQVRAKVLSATYSAYSETYTYTRS